MSEKHTESPKDNADPAAFEEAELRRLARSRPSTGRGQVAKLGAVRTLERMERGRRPSRPSMPAGWHPGPAGFEKLDAGDPPRLREQWWQALHG